MLSAFAVATTPSASLGVLQDTVVIGEAPLPGGVTALVRLLFHVPQWFQIVGLIAGVLVALSLLYVLWIRRRMIVTWALTRPRGLKVAMAVAVLGVVLAAAGTGTVSWNYMQHENDFCSGCHVMAPAFDRFAGSEHDSLSCHDCHQQSIFASMRQLYLWVLERPEDIGTHAPVANAVCQACHVTGEPEVWQRIASTAGHRTHLESDSSALRDVMCVTCHGLEVHKFLPVDSTCAQADCHVGTESQIALGAMQEQTALHCITCHEFTAEVPALATRDSATGTLVPNMEQCLSCHEMRAVLADFDVAFDPHSGTCGMCHNPHEDVVVTDANASCTAANCHIDWRAEPFHTGTEHVDVGSQCILCHEPHRAKVDASDCAGCHAEVAGRPHIPDEMRRRLQRAEPFDTTRALRRQSSLLPWQHAPLVGQAGIRDSPPVGMSESVSPVHLFSRATRSFPIAQPDTFSHDEHESLTCLTCHTTRTGHGALTFEAPRGCQICHHQAPATSDCASCHEQETLVQPNHATVRVVVEGEQPRERPVDFTHGSHESVTCVTCHVTAVTLATAETTATCVDCHEDHHTANRTCVPCHARQEVEDTHTPPAEAHVSCDACHEAATVATLMPDRSFCLACHAETDHYPEHECTVCHMQLSPEEFRRALMTRGDGP